MAFAQQGAAVLVADIDEENGLKTVNSISEQSGRAVFAKGDVTSSTDAERLVATAVEQFGRLDILANVVGGSRPGQTAVDLPEAEWDRLIKFNLYGTFLMCKYAIPRLIEAGGGAIVNVASGAGINGMPKNPAYCAAKGGLHMLTQTMAVELGPSGVQTNCIAPTVIMTPMAEAIWTPGPRTDTKRSKIPMGRFGEAEEVADLVLFLASPLSDFVNGTIIPIDGGEGAG